MLYEEGKFRWLRLYICIQDGLLYFGNSVLASYCMYFAYYAEINQGVITCLFALETIYLASMAYLIQNEKLKLYQVVGMTFLVLCVIVLGLSDLVTTSTTAIALEDRVSVFLPLILSVIGPFFFALRLFVAKFFAARFNVPAMQICLTG